MSYICVTPLTMNLNNPELAVAQEPVLEAVRALHTGVTRKPRRIAAFWAQARADTSIPAALVTAPITLLEPLQHPESPEGGHVTAPRFADLASVERRAHSPSPVPKGPIISHLRPRSSLKPPVSWSGHPRGCPACPLSPTVKEESTPSGSPVYNPGDAAIKTEEQWLDSSQLESRINFELWEAPAYEPSGPSMKKEEEEVEHPASPLYDPIDDEEIKSERQPVRDYRTSSPAPVKMEETVAKTEPMATIKVEEEWLDSSQLELRPSPPPYPSQAELRRFAGELLNRIGEMRESVSPQPYPPSTQVTAPKGGDDAALAPMEEPDTPAAESSANSWEPPTWTSLLSLLDDLTRPSLKWLTEVDDMEWLEQYAPIDLHAPPAHVNGTPSPAMGDVYGEGDQREGGTPGWTVDKQEGQDSEHPTTLGGEKKRGEKREREETENPHPEEHLWLTPLKRKTRRRSRSKSPLK